ncbi:MAG: hypothetical protein Q8P49_02210 [Candidatus Liptonbacteria bacterium]|nr:hypothetical protein [Candidatus Liptonbacteria bacterium]
MRSDQETKKAPKPPPQKTEPKKPAPEKKKPDEKEDEITKKRRDLLRRLDERKNKRGSKTIRIKKHTGKGGQ